MAFGDGRKIIWNRYGHEIYRNNPNVAPPGGEHLKNLDWVHHYPGRRLYASGTRERWTFVPGQMAGPGEMFLSSAEKTFGRRHGDGFVVVEPHVPSFKNHCVANKRWPWDNYRRVAQALSRRGVMVVQFQYGPPYGPVRKLPDAVLVSAPDFRHALAIIGSAALYVGNEGGLHHGAAAMGTRAVVLFGGFISPDVSGYDTHDNVFTGGRACGNLSKCQHCQDAMGLITVDRVLSGVDEMMRLRRAV